MKSFRIFLKCIALVAWAPPAFGQAIPGAPSGFSAIVELTFVASSITVNPNGIGAAVGTTVPFSATFADEFQNTLPACLSSGWASSNPSVATINAASGVASAVSVGTTTITCSGSNLVGSAQLVVETAPIFSNPATPCTQPCELESGTQGQAYSLTLAASGGTAPYTYSITVGSLPTGLNLTAGVISGTPSGTGASTFTTRVCDSLSACTSLQMSLTILAAVGCTTAGPPAYTCASTSMADTTVPLTSIFTSTAYVSIPGTLTSGVCQAGETFTQAITGTTGTAFGTCTSTNLFLSNQSRTPDNTHTWTGGSSGAIFTPNGSAPSYLCSGDCQNSVKEDTQLPGHIAGTYKYTRISDGASLRGKSVSNFTPSGGDNARVISEPNGQFVYPVTEDGQKLFELTVSGGAFQVVNSGPTPPLIIRGLGFSASGVVETRFFHRITTASASSLWQGDLTGLVSGHVVNGTTNYTDTFVFDFMGPGNCPGITPYTIGWVSQVAVSQDDDVFMMALGPSGGNGQGYADKVFAYSKTKGIAGGPGCAVIDFSTGQQWAFTKCAPGTCTGSETPSWTYADVPAQCWGSRGSLGWGIHNAQLSGDGVYAVVSRQNAANGWTKGGCASGPGGVTVNLLTGQNQFCANDTLQCSGHWSIGMNHGLYTYWATGMSTRSLSDVTSFNVFWPIPPIADEHCSWPVNVTGSYGDTGPWICAGNAVTAAGGGVYTPKYLNNEIFIVDPTLPNTQVAKRFGHTFSCNGNLGATCTDGIPDAFGPGNSIGMARPRADGFCYASSMLHGLGNTSTGVPRADVFCVYMGN